MESSPHSLSLNFYIHWFRYGFCPWGFASVVANGTTGQNRRPRNSGWRPWETQLFLRERTSYWTCIHGVRHFGLHVFHLGCSTENKQTSRSKNQEAKSCSFIFIVILVLACLNDKARFAFHVSWQRINVRHCLEVWKSDGGRAVIVVAAVWDANWAQEIRTGAFCWDQEETLRYI